MTRIGIGFVASATYLVTIRDAAGDVLAQGETDATLNTIATTSAIAVTMNGLLPAFSVLVVGNPDHLLLLAEVRGREFSVEIGTNEEGQAGGAITGQVFAQTGPDLTTSVNRAALGLSMFSSNDPDPEIGGTFGEYAGTDGMRLLVAANSMWVERPGAVSNGDPVFVELDGALPDVGRLFAVASVSRERLLGATWERDDEANGIAAVRVSF